MKAAFHFTARARVAEQVKNIRCPVYGFYGDTFDG